MFPKWILKSLPVGPCQELWRGSPSSRCWRWPKDGSASWWACWLPRWWWGSWSIRCQQHKLYWERSTWAGECREQRWREPWRQGRWQRGTEYWHWRRSRSSRRSSRMIRRTVEYGKLCFVFFPKYFSCHPQPGVSSVIVDQASHYLQLLHVPPGPPSQASNFQWQVCRGAPLEGPTSGRRGSSRAGRTTWRGRSRSGRQSSWLGFPNW